MSDNNKCIHCGADCGKSPIVWNNMKFCCNGCKTVYQLLNENKLYSYYNLEDNPGIKIDTVDVGNKYEYLDNEEVQEKLFVFKEGNIVKVKFKVPVIHCAACIWLLEHLNTLNKGISNSTVHFVKKEVNITFDRSEISLRQVVELMASIHYVPEISLDSLEDKGEKKSDKKLLAKIGTAGFVFGNVMLYSLPDYFNGGEPLPGNLNAFLGYLSFILTIPVVFYSGNDYIISAYKNLKKRVVNIDLPIALGVIVLFLVTAYEVLSGTGQGYSDSLSGLIFFLLVGKFYQGRTYEALSFDRDYKSYFPIAVTKVTDKGEESVLLKEVKPDDVLLIRNKELIPADSKMVEGLGLIDYSFVTGESTPVKKSDGDFIYAGGRQTGGSIKVRVDKEVEQSHLTKLWNDAEDAKIEQKSLNSIVDKVSQYFTIIVVSIALLGAIFWLITGDYHTAIFAFSAVLIVACPCALALSIPFTFGNTMRLFGNAGLYIKNTEVIERLTKVDTVVFDKTGTITKPDESNITFVGEELSEHEIIAALSIAKQSTHPLSNAIFNFYKDKDYIEPEHFVEMSGRGIYGKVGNIDIKIGSDEYVIDKEITDDKTASRVYLSINEQYKGYWNISNKYRDGFEQIISKLKTNFDLYLLSGDNDSEKANLEKYFDADKIIFNQKPQDKKDFIANLQKQGKTVLMTGDGLNDAGALMQSDVALTIADNVYHFSPAGDAILEAAKFDKLYSFIHFTKKAMNIVKLSFTISFIYNVIGIGFAVTGTLSPVIAAILMPISSVSVVTFATFVTRFVGRKL